MVLRRLASQMLRNEAARRAQQAVASAAQGAAQPREEDEPDRPPEPCQVGVVFALPIESGGLRDLMQGVVRIKSAQFTLFEGGLAGRSVVVVESGPGQENAARATEVLIAGHRPQWVITAGLAGGLVSEAAACDIVLATELVRATGERLAIELAREPQPGVHLGRLLTVDQVIYQAEQKKALGEEHAAMAVDMESFAVADACRRRAIRCLAVRAICDTVDDELPADVQHLLAQETWTGKLGAAAGSIFRRPSHVKDLWRLRESALVAGIRLGEFLAELIPQLPVKTIKSDAASEPESD
jgi:adenosylhomocysteine nucleosidase